MNRGQKVRFNKKVKKMKTLEFFSNKPILLYPWKKELYPWKKEKSVTFYIWMGFSDYMYR